MPTQATATPCRILVRAKSELNTPKKGKHLKAMRRFNSNWELQGLAWSCATIRALDTMHGHRSKAIRRLVKANGLKASAATVALLMALPSLTQATVINLASPDSQWTPIIFSSGGTNDYTDDDQAGSIGDIVGNATVPGAMWQFNGSGTPSLTDGDIAFRLRLGSPNGNKTYFSGIALFGLDFNLDAKIDTYVAAGRSSNTDYVWIANPGTGLNISPSTSTFDLTNAWRTYTGTFGATSNLYYAATTDGIDVDGGTSGKDMYFAFQMPFADLVSTVGTRLGMSINETSAISFVVATSNQVNSLNQDIAGINDKTAVLTQTWSTLGSITPPVSANGQNLLLWLGNYSTEWSTNTIAPNKNWTSNADGVNNPPFTNLTLRMDYTPNDIVTFNDKALNYDQFPGNTSTVNISVANVAPAAVYIDNSALNYLFQGTYGITGTTSIVKTGTGTATFTNTNTYTGGTVLSGGTISINNGGALGSGQVSIGSATLNLAGTSAYTLANNIGLASASSTLDVTNTAPVTLSGTVQDISGTGIGALTKTGSGTLVLTNSANAWSGTTTISAGTLQVGNGGTTGTIGTGNIIDNGALVVNRSNNIAITSDISGTGTLTQAGTAVLALTGNNTYAGTTTISSGALSVGNGGTTGTLGTGAVVDNGQLGFNRSDTITVANAISGSGTLVQAGTGTTILTGNNTYAGTTTIQYGTLQVGNGGTTGSLGAGAVTNDSALVFNRSDDITVANAIGGIGALTQAGSGTLTLTANNTYAGGTLISAGTLQVGNGGTTGSLGSGPIEDNSLLVFNRSDTTTVANAIGGTGSLTKLGTNTLVLTGGNTYAGTTTISGGTLQVGNGGTTGSLGLDNVHNSGTLIFNRSDDITVANNIDGTGALTKLGAGTTTLSGFNTYTGTTTINAGTLNLTGGYAIADTGAVVIANAAGASLALGDNETIGSLSGGGTTGGSVQLNGFNLTVGDSSSTTFAGTISGNEYGDLIKQGSGTLTLSGTNTYGGITVVNGGTLSISSRENLGTTGTSKVLQLNNGATLQTTADITFNTRIFDLGSGGGIFDVASGTTLTTGGTTGYIQGSSLTKTGAGTLVLDGANTYSGNTTISAGTLKVADDGTLTGGAYTGDIANSGIFNYSSTSDQVLDGVISGTGSLVKNGTGSTSTLTLSGANTYTGTTTVSNGTLNVTGSIASGSAVSVAGGATLMGTGTVGGTATISSGGIVTGGDGTAGTLTVGNLTFNGTGTVNIGNVINYTSTAAVNVTGTLTLNGGAGAVTLNLGSAGAPNGTYHLIDTTLNSISGFSLGSTPTLSSRQSGSLQYTADYINYVITGDYPYWTGAQSSEWSTATIPGSKNWQLVSGGTATDFITYDVALFNDNATGTTSVTINTTDVQPSAVIFDNSTKNYTLSGDSGITGIASLGKSGTGSLTINTANDYTGGTTLNAGSLVVGNDSALGTGGVALVGGTLDVNGHTIANDIVLDGGTLAGNGGTVSGTISDGTASTLAVGSSITLSGSNTYTGGTTLTAGTLTVADTMALGGGTVALNGGTLALAGYTINNNIVLGGGSISGAGGTISGNISDGTASTLTVASDLTLSGTNTYTGTTTIDGATLTIEGRFAIADTGAVVLTGTAGSELVLANSERIGSLSGQGTVDLQGYDLTVGDSSSTTYAGVIAGTEYSNLVKVGSGTLTLSGTNTYGGNTIINGGTLSISSRENLGALLTSQPLQINNGATLQTTADIEFHTRVFDLGSGGGTFDVASGTTLAIGFDDGVNPPGYVEGIGGLTKTGTGTLLLEGPNNYTGNTTISAGILEVGGAGTLGVGAYFGDIANAATLYINTSADQLLAGTVSGSGDLLKGNTGTLTLTGTNSYAGDTTVNAGTLDIAGGGQLG